MADGPGRQHRRQAEDRAYVDYPGYGNQGHRTTANMYVTLLQLAGSQRTEFGMPDPNLKDLDQHGPLEELLA